MKELLDKISSYNIFNYLFPGIIFVVLLREISDFDLYQENSLLGAFLYYFIGLVISRVGSLIIEPVLKKLKIINFTAYSDYVSASKKDENIVLFSEINNMYRTLTSAIMLALLAKLYEVKFDLIGLTHNQEMVTMAIFLLLLFVFSYRKQSDFVVARVEVQKSDSEQGATR